MKLDRLFAFCLVPTLVARVVAMFSLPVLVLAAGAQGQDRVELLVVAPTDPPSIAGLKVWLRADAVATNDVTQVRATSGNLFVRRWNNQSDAANPAAQTSDDLQPQFVPAVVELNNQPALRFDGINDRLILGDSPAQNSFCVITVARTGVGHEVDQQSEEGTDGVSGQRYLLGAPGGDFIAGAALSVGTNGISVYEHGVFYMPALAVYQGPVGTGFTIISVNYSNKQPFLFWQGSLASVGVSSPRAVVTAPTEIGTGMWGAFSGDVAEVLIYGRALSETERRSVEEHLARKYTLHLPVHLPAPLHHNSKADAGATGLPAFDFTQSSGTHGWVAAHDISKLDPTTNGLVVTISGDDPFLIGPPRNYPANEPLWLRLRLTAERGGMCQVFYFITASSEPASVRFHVPAGRWVEGRVPLPALGTNYRMRIDPPGTNGTCVLGRLSFELRPVIQEPAWPRPVPPVIASDAPRVISGELSLVHDRSAPGAFELRVNGQRVAIGNTRSTLGYASGGSQRWLTLTNPASVETSGETLRVRAGVIDPDGARWQLEQTYQPSAIAGGIKVESRVEVNQERRIVFLPMFTLLPGVGSFGANKSQALLAGVEYLENESSSSEADMAGPASRRRVPYSPKLTFPLMALAADGSYVGLMWEPQPRFAALHDSPDRLFQSGGHLMGVIFPGADLATREDGSVLPYGDETLRAGETLLLRATILGGSGQTIVPAVRQFVARRGLPSVPDTGYRAADYFTLAAHGWLDSQIRDGAKFRHAFRANFGSTPAVDAALYMDWLAAKVPDTRLSARLTSAAHEARAIVSPASYNSATIGHVRFPVEALLYGCVPDNARTALNEGRAQLALFQPDGAILYQAPPGGIDLSRTHSSREANGLTATHVAIALERGLFSGDRALINEGLRLLRALNKFRDGVPRGAQTWEVPLHTPDILASACLVRAYTIGYELTGDRDFLEEARYWAWTGVPFVYLTPPNDEPVGVYCTIPVFGATQFDGPVWIGLPVQWCGLVYGNAVRRLARHDPDGPWIQLADGIAAAGIQQTHPLADIANQGLLPDSFNLREQTRNPVPINPATLLPEAIAMFGEPAVYDFRSLRRHGLLVHAPGPITDVKENSKGVSFRVSGWPKSPWHVLINGFTARPTVKLNGTETSIVLPHQFQETEGRLILRLNQPTMVEIQIPAADALRF